MAHLCINVDIDEFNDTDLVNELRRRGYSITKEIHDPRNKVDQIIRMFQDLNPNVCILDTMEIEDHIRRVLLYQNTKTSSQITGAAMAPSET